MPTRAEVFARHKPLALRVAKGIARTLPRHVSAEDLHQAALVGLWESTRKYHALPPGEFAAVATVRMRGAVIDEIRALQWLPRRNRKRFDEPPKYVYLDAFEALDYFVALSTRPDIEGDIDFVRRSRALVKATRKLPTQSAPSFVVCLLVTLRRRSLERWASRRRASPRF